MASLPVGHIDLDCGIAYRRIAAWLNDELACLHADGKWLYEADGAQCCVKLEVLEPRALGNIELERTRLTATGDPTAVDSFHSLFTLRFASAGG